MVPQFPHRTEQQRPREILQKRRDGQPAETSDCSARTQGRAQSTPDWQDLGLGNNHQIHKDPSWATQSNLGQHRQTGVKTIKTRPEAMQAHESSAAQPMSTIPAERTAVEARGHHAGRLPSDPLSSAHVCRGQREVKYKWEEQVGVGFRGQEAAGGLLAPSLWCVGLAVSGSHRSVANTAACHVSA